MFVFLVLGEFLSMLTSAERHRPHTAFDFALEVSANKESMLTSVERQQPHAFDDFALEVGAKEDNWTQPNTTAPPAMNSVPIPFPFTIKDYLENGYNVPRASDRRVISVSPPSDDDLKVTVDLDVVKHFTSAIQEKLSDANVPKTRPDSDMWSPEEGYRVIELKEGGNFEHAGWLGSGGGKYTVFTLNVMPGRREALKRSKHAGIVRGWLKKLANFDTEDQWAWLIGEEEVFHVGTHFHPTRNETSFGPQHFHMMSSRAFTEEEIARVEKVVHKRNMAGVA